jgi:hypothetical protein
MGVNQYVDGVPNHLVARSSVNIEETLRRKIRRQLYTRATRVYHVGESYSIQYPSGSRLMSPMRPSRKKKVCDPSQVAMYHG